MKFKEVLRTQVKKHGVTIKSLSRNTGIPLATLNNWLVGIKPGNIDQVKKVADYFDVTLDYLLYEKDPPPRKEDLISFGNYDVYLKKKGR